MSMDGYAVPLSILELLVGLDCLGVYLTIIISLRVSPEMSCGVDYMTASLHSVNSLVNSNLICKKVHGSSLLFSPLSQV